MRERVLSFVGGKCAKRLGALVASAVIAVATLVSVAPTTANVAVAASNPVEEACSGVVRIFATYQFEYNGYIYSSYSCGSGFGVGAAGESTDTFVTNWHVVNGEDYYGNEIVCDVYIMMDDKAVSVDYSYDYSTGEWVESWNPDYSKMIKCDVLYSGQEYPDVAVIRATEDVGRIALPLLKAENGARGESIYTLGFPGSSDTSTVDETNSGYMPAGIDSVVVATGTISRFQKMELNGNTSCILHDAHINHGNSGGPLVNSNGAVIGINTYGFGNSEGMEYSVSIYIDYAMLVLDKLEIPYDVYTEPEAEVKEDKGDEEAADIAPTAIDDDDEFTYEKVDDEDGFEKYMWIILVAAVVLLAVVILVVVIVLTKKKGSDKKAEIRLVANGGVFLGRRFAINGVVRMGRDASSNEIVFPEGTPGISGKHCQLQLNGEYVVLTDLGSTYGTFVNGMKLSANQSVQLNPGDSFYLADGTQNFTIYKK